MALKSRQAASTRPRKPPALNQDQSWLLWEAVALRSGGKESPGTAAVMDLEEALNATLLAACSCRLDMAGPAENPSEFVVSLLDYPQCRGEGATVAAALQRAR